jgi:tRNA threonylcarbamoyladenosine biosynthesis protein TsaB
MEYQACMTDKPLVLALDIALGGLTVALSGGTLKAPVTLADTTPRASDTLHTRLQQILEDNGLNLQSLTQYATTTGPGSFTGIRLGLAVGQALKLLNPNLILTGLPTLALLARQLAPQPTEFTILTDAAGQTAYRQSFDAKGCALDKPTCIPVTTLPTGLIFADSALMLANTQALPRLAPQTLLAAVADNISVPFEPAYVKPLTYRTAS